MIKASAEMQALRSALVDFRAEFDKPKDPSDKQS